MNKTVYLLKSRSPNSAAIGPGLPPAGTVRDAGVTYTEREAKEWADRTRSVFVDAWYEQIEIDETKLQEP